MKARNFLTLLISMGLVFSLLPITVSAEEWSSFQSNNENNGYYTGTLTTDFSGTNWDAYYAPSGWACWDSAPVIGNGTVFAVKNTGNIVALNLTTGNEVWYEDTIGGSGFFELCTPAYDEDNDRLYVGLSAGNAITDTGIHALDAATGDVLWSNTLVAYFPANHQLLSGIKYDSETGYIYFGSWGSNGRFYCVDEDTGNVIWYHISTSNGYYWATPAIIGDYVVVGNEDGVVTCYDKMNGIVEDIYDYDTNATAPIRSGITYDSNTEYIFYTVKTGGSNGDLVAASFNTNNGHIGDTYANETNDGLSGSITMTPTVVDGLVFVNHGYGVATFHSSAIDDGYTDSISLEGMKSSPVVTKEEGTYYIYVVANNFGGICYCLSCDNNGNNLAVQDLWSPAGSDYTLQGIAAADG
jgi:outer membrane protein assembly factor BamB